MAYRIGGSIAPERLIKRYGENKVEGFGLPYFNGHEQLLVAVVHDDRIVGLQPMQPGEKIVVTEADKSFRGACEAVVGQPALYSFRNPVTKHCDIATRAILAPQIESWLREGPLGENDDVITQAKEFCDGKMPKALEILYAELELETLKLRRAPGHGLN